MDASHKVRVGLLAAVIALTSTQALQAQVFSLDDNPSFPLTTPVPAPGATPFPPFGFGAEDPFGTVFGPPGLAPSPSLAPPTTGPWLDGDLLETGAVFPSEPELHLFAPFDGITGLPHTYIDALSNNSIPSPPSPPATINILFSIDRMSTGVPGSESSLEAGFNQQPGDIYVSSTMFAEPSAFAGTLPPGVGFFPGPLNPPSPGTNSLLFNQDAFDLTAGLPPGPGSGIPPFAPAPPIFPGTHDNVDAFELRDLDTDGDLVADEDYFFSINPDDAVNKQFATGGVPFDSADIWIAPAGAGGASFLYAPAAAMGLAPMPIFPFPPIFMANDIDGLVVWDVGADGIVVAGVDFALFSLAPGSVDLAAFGNSPTDVFFTDFSGSYAIFASAADLGLLPTDNVDALEIVLSGDANLDGVVTIADLAMVALNYGLALAPPANNWMLGDFDGNNIVGLSDLVVFAANFGLGTGASVDDIWGLLSPGVPEPSPAALAALALLGGMFFRRRRTVLANHIPAMLRCGGGFVLLLSFAASTPAAQVSVNTSSLGVGLFQHRLTVTANDGDVRGFEIVVTDALARINDINVVLNSVFLDDTMFFPLLGENPAEDTHVLYNSTDGFNLMISDTATSFSVATGVAPGTPLVVNGTSRDLFQLVTVGNVGLVATNLRVNVGGGGGDQLFDGLLLQSQPGDYNGDGTVNGADYVIWRNTFGMMGVGLVADGDGDGIIDDDDYDVWRAYFGQPAGPGSGSGSTLGSPSLSAIPEPATLWLVLGAAAMGCSRGFRRQLHRPAHSLLP